MEPKWLGMGEYVIFYKIKCILVHRVLYGTEHSLRLSGQGFNAKI